MYFDLARKSSVVFYNTSCFYPSRLLSMGTNEEPRRSMARIHLEPWPVAVQSHGGSAIMNRTCRPLGAATCCFGASVVLAGFHFFRFVGTLEQYACRRPSPFMESQTETAPDEDDLVPNGHSHMHTRFQWKSPITGITYIHINIYN